MNIINNYSQKLHSVSRLNTFLESVREQEEKECFHKKPEKQGKDIFDFIVESDIRKGLMSYTPCDIPGSGAELPPENAEQTVQTPANVDAQNILEENKTENFNKTHDNLCDRFSATNENTDKETAEMKRVTLNGLLKRVEMMQGTMYSSRSWEQLMKMYGITKPVSLDDEAAVEDLEKAIRDLTGAITALKNAEHEDTKQRELLPLTIEPGGTAYEQAKMSADFKAVAQAINTAFNGDVINIIV